MVIFGGMNCKRLIGLLIIAALLQGCMLSGKMTRIVSEYYAPKAKLRMQESPAWLSIKTDSLQRVYGYCEARYKRFFTVPLLFYTYSDEKMECKINPKIYANFLSSALQKQLTAAGMENKLSGKVLEVSLSQVPSTFYHRYYSHYIILQNLLHFSITENELSNRAGTVRLSYILRDQTTQNIIKAGVLSAPVAGSFYTKYYSERRLYFVQNFVATFDRQLQTAIDQLSTDLIYQL